MLRLTSKIFTVSTLFKPRNLVSLRSLKFMFSSSKTFESTSPLVKALQEEIKYEKEHSPGSESLVNSIKKKGWQINSQDTRVQMRKKVSDKVVTTVFYVEPPHPQDQIIGENDQADKTGTFGDYTEFTVYIEKANNPKIMYADFLCNSEEIRLVNLNFTEDYNTHKMIQKHNRPLSTYQGPEIYTMDSNLLSNINEYFEEFGVTNELASFIQQYSKNSQHPLYVQWLEDLEQFIK